MEDQRKGVLHHGFGGITAGVADGDAAAVGLGQVNVVVARCKQADVAQLFGVPQRFGGHRRFVAEHNIRVADPFGHLLFTAQRIILYTAEAFQNRKIEVTVRDGLAVR